MAVEWTDSEIDSTIRFVFMRLGYEEVKSEQLVAIRGFFKGNVFISLPTGSGKS